MYHDLVVSHSEIIRNQQVLASFCFVKDAPHTDVEVHWLTIECE
jgi:hypothetical protein